MDNCLNHHLCVLHIFLKLTFYLSCHFFSFISTVCTKPTLTQQSEASTSAVQMLTVRHESKPAHHNTLITERVSYSHIVCLSRDFSTNIQDVFVVSRKWPNSKSIVISDISIQHYQNITVPRVWIALVSVKVTISSEKHAASVFRVKFFFLYDVDIWFLLDLVRLHLVHRKLLHYRRSWAIHLLPSELQISTRIHLYNHCPNYAVVTLRKCKSKLCIGLVGYKEYLCE
jgi:hypothetical protein